MMKVYENGEPPDVIDLITRYKEAKGLHKKEEPDPQLDKKNETQKKIDEKVANLSAVKTKTGPINVSDRKPKAGAEDFDGAFDEAEVYKRR
jgi:hypothetical protein